MSHYHHLSITERESIWELRIKGQSIREIARKIKRSASTISRELKRNSKQSYRPSNAQARYEKKRRQSVRKRLLDEPCLREKVLRLLVEQQWSPEQISQRLALEKNGKISYGTIYRALKQGYMEKKRKKSKGKYPLQKCLRRKGRPNTKKETRTQSFIHQGIEQRPKAAQTRSQFGHWEGDLVYSSFHKRYIVTMIDRRSRFLLTTTCESRKPHEVAEKLKSLLAPLPAERLRSITLDRGPEFAQHALVTADIPHAQFYFAHPMSPWERALNENTNGLLREYVPKRSYKRPFSHQLLCQFTYKLNHRPRKCLRWKSPFEVFFHLLLHLT